MKFSFSVNLYDSDGDVFDRGIFLHSQGTTGEFVIKVKNIEALDSMIDNLKKIRNEAIESYEEVLTSNEYDFKSVSK